MFTTLRVIFTAYKRLHRKMRSMTIFRKRKIPFYRRTGASIIHVNIHYREPFYDGPNHVKDKYIADFTDLNRNRCSDVIIVILLFSDPIAPFLSKTVFGIYSYT